MTMTTTRKVPGSRSLPKAAIASLIGTRVKTTKPMASAGKP